MIYAQNKGGSYYFKILSCFVQRQKKKRALKQLSVLKFQFAKKLLHTVLTTNFFRHPCGSCSPSLTTFSNFHSMLQVLGLQTEKIHFEKLIVLGNNIQKHTRDDKVNCIMGHISPNVHMTEMTQE